MEPELLIPISVVAFTDDADPEEIRLPQLTLCGDIHQREFSDCLSL